MMDGAPVSCPNHRRFPHVVRRFSFQALEPRRVLSATPIGDGLVVNDFTLGEQQLTAEAEAVATLSDGTIVVAFEGRGVGDLHGIYLRRFEADGTPVENAETAELVNTTFNGEQFSPSVAAFDDGSFVVVWAGRGVGDRYGVFAQWYDANGQKEGTETRINETVGGRQMDPHVATDADGRTIVTWHGVGDGDVDGVFVRIFDNSAANFAPVTAEIRANGTTEDQQAFSDVATDAEGGFLVTWSSRHVDGSAAVVTARRFDEDGTATGAETLVNQVMGANQMHASVAALATGDFVVAWSDRSGGSGEWDVMARRLDADGQPVGDALVLNQTDAGQQLDVQIAATATGGFLAVWNSNTGDGSGSQIAARQFDAAGGPLDDQSLVSHSGGGADFGGAHFPSVSVRDEQATIVWAHGRGNGADGVFGQRVEVDTTVGLNLAPIIESIDTQQARRGVEFVLAVTARDINSDDVLSFALDPTASPANATITQTSATTAEIRWTPGTADLPSRTFRLIVTDDGDPALSGTESFQVNVAPSAGMLS